MQGLKMFSQGSNSEVGSTSKSDNCTFTSKELVTGKFTAEVSKVNKGCPLWAYVTVIEKKKSGLSNTSWRCNYCNRSYKGSYSRVRCHLLKEKRHGISVCSAVSCEHVEEMKRIEREISETSKPMPEMFSKKGRSIVGSKSIQLIEDSEKRLYLEYPSKESNDEAKDCLNGEIAKWFYFTGLSFDVIRNPHFMDFIAYAANNTISGFVPPSCKALRTTLLQNEKTRLLKLLEPIKDIWICTGVTIIISEWENSQRRPFINIMAAYNSSAICLKVIDCYGHQKDKHYIANLIVSTIDEVGSKNVVQVIVNNANICEDVGSLIESVYPHIFWTSCIVHTLDLMLKNICSVKSCENSDVVSSEHHWISAIIGDVNFIKDFIVNHPMKSSMFDEFPYLKPLDFDDSRFASVVAVMKHLLTIKNKLQTMVTTPQWSPYSESDPHKSTKLMKVLLNNFFWDQVQYIFRFTNPLCEMMNFCDTDEPNMWSIYEKWVLMIETVKATIYEHEKKDFTQYSSFFDIVNKILMEGWSRRCTLLYYLSHSLNPRYYCRQWLEEFPNRVAPHNDNGLRIGRDNCLKRYFLMPQEWQQVVEEFEKFSTFKELPGMRGCLDDRWSLKPKVWWGTYGSLFPRLQSIALKLFSQPSTSCYCENHWSSYSFLRRLRGSKMNSESIEDLLFVHINLRLLSKMNYGKSFDRKWDLSEDNCDSFQAGCPLTD